MISNKIDDYEVHYAETYVDPYEVMDEAEQVAAELVVLNSDIESIKIVVLSEMV